MPQCATNINEGQPSSVAKTVAKTLTGNRGNLGQSLDEESFLFKDRGENSHTSKTSAANEDLPRGFTNFYLIYYYFIII
jgi:hypothetical protein